MHVAWAAAGHCARTGCRVELCVREERGPKVMLRWACGSRGCLGTTGHRQTCLRATQHHTRTHMNTHMNSGWVGGWMGCSVCVHICVKQVSQAAQRTTIGLLRVDQRRACVRVCGRGGGEGGILPRMVRAMFCLN